MRFEVTLQGCVAPVVTVGVAPGTRKTATIKRPSAS
jgi:hypothetical protein